MIKAVIFDYGNVISVPQTGDYTREMEKRSGVPASVFKTVYDEERFDFDRGVINGATMYSRLLTQHGYYTQAADLRLLHRLARLDMQSWRPYNKEVSDWGLSLQKQGFKLGILSNMPIEFLDNYKTEIPLFTAADYACFSCNEHLIKPEPAIYRKVLEGLEVHPDEAVFFDDIQENIDAAVQIGIYGFLWKSLDQGRKDWQAAIELG